MSALGQERTFRHLRSMSALPPKADIRIGDREVRYVPQADIRDLCRNPPRLIFGEQPGSRSLARLSIGLRHTIGAAAKSSQFCLFEGGQLLRVSGDCEGPHAGSHSQNLSASRNFDARGSYALRGCQRNLYTLVRRLTWCIAFSAVLTWLRLCGPSIGATTTRVTFGIARNAAPVFRPWSPFLTIPTLSCCAAIVLGFAQRLQELGDIRRNPPRLIFREQLGR
jgi:hypothetical protein